ncbi:MAG: ribonuclease R family protein [bacterium]
MSKPGDVVEFKSGLFAIEAPRNLGILLERRRVKGVALVRLATLDGEKECKAEHLTKRLFRSRYEGDLRQTADVAARLRHLVAQHAGGALAEEPEDDLDRLEEALWEATCDDGRPEWSEQDIAQAHYGMASPVQLRDVRAALDRDRRPGVGRFQPAGRGDLWRPWRRSEADAMRKASQELATLRRSLIHTEETELGKTFTAVAMDAAALPSDLAATLAWVRRAMEQFVDWDGIPHGEPVAGIGGLGAVDAFGMDLHRQLGFLAQDWIQSEHTSRSSDYIHFLLGTRLWGPQDAVDALIRRHVNQEEFFEHVADARAEDAAAAHPEPDLAMDPARTDLRHLPCYTIDPPDAKDFDDAAGLEPLPAPGHVRLWVHVADVSHYVTPDSTLDRHAKKRATSVYLPGRVLPMLPHRLSDHLCSLRSDGDRFALSVGMDVDGDGHIVARQFRKAAIRVTENLAYGQALARAKAGEEPFAGLLALAARMRRHRGGLELETGELKVLLGATGFSALEKRADEATRMIETFMVAANEAVAEHLAAADVAQLFRCHPLPDRTKASRLAHQLETMGIDVQIDLPGAKALAAGPGESILDQLRRGGGKLELFGGGIAIAGGAAEAPKLEAPQKVPGFAQLVPEERAAWLAPFRKVVAALASHPDDAVAEVATLKVLAAMGRAYYTPDNEGHFGLASTHYCHFTSPIRRYPDLVVHRNLKWLIDGRSGHAPHTAESLRALCDHCSNQERAADQLERRIKSSCLVLASLDENPDPQADAATEAGAGSGREASARITGITPASVFVLRGDGIEARIPGRDLPGGPYQADEWESMLLFPSPIDADTDDKRAAVQDVTQWLDPESGELRRVRARLADKVTVRLAGRDVAAGRTGAQLLRWA